MHRGGGRWEVGEGGRGVGRIEMEGKGGGGEIG